MILNSDQSRLKVRVVCCTLSRNTTRQINEKGNSDTPAATWNSTQKKSRTMKEMGARKQEWESKEKVYLNVRLNYINERLNA